LKLPGLGSTACSTPLLHARGWTRGARPPPTPPVAPLRWCSLPPPRHATLSTAPALPPLPSPRPGAAAPAAPTSACAATCAAPLRLYWLLLVTTSPPRALASACDGLYYFSARSPTAARRWQTMGASRSGHLPTGRAAGRFAAPPRTPLPFSAGAAAIGVPDSGDLLACIPYPVVRRREQARERALVDARAHIIGPLSPPVIVPCGLRRIAVLQGATPCLPIPRDALSGSPCWPRLAGP